MWTFWSDLLREWESWKNHHTGRVLWQSQRKRESIKKHISVPCVTVDTEGRLTGHGESYLSSLCKSARQSLLGASYLQGSLRKPNISGNNPQNQWDSAISLEGDRTCYRNSQNHRRAYPSESERLHVWVFLILLLVTTASCSTISTHGPLPKDIFSTTHRQKGLQDQSSTPLTRKWRILAMKDLASKLLMPKKCHCHWADCLLG